MNQKSPNIILQSQISEQALEWHRAVFSDIEERLGVNSAFPCIFSKNAFRKKLLKFIFVEAIDAEGIRHLAAALREYVDLSREWDRSIDTAYPAIVAFSLNAIVSDSVEHYQAFGWDVLQKLHAVDSASWPEQVSKDPESTTWSMCFDGMPLFCNMSSPAHSVRKSRNLGAHFTMVINPRERFDVIAGDTPGGRQVRANIRNRVQRYDGVPHALQLGSFGVGGIEWWQYGLIEENIERRDKCPFRFRQQSSSTAEAD